MDDSIGTLRRALRGSEPPVVGISSLGVCPSDLRAVVGASLDGKVTEGGDVDSTKNAQVNANLEDLT